ncbi:MAG: hypothetical protein U0528_20930 [Anaerolineae bacterium]
MPTTIAQKVYRYIQNFAQSIADSTTAIELDAQQSDFYLYRGIAYFRSGERQLQSDFDKASGIDSNSYIAYAERSNSQRIGGDLDAAQADIAACLKACPDAFEKYAKAAFLYHDLGDIEGAILSSERALQIQLDHHDAALVQQRSQIGEIHNELLSTKVCKHARMLDNTSVFPTYRT